MGGYLVIGTIYAFAVVVQPGPLQAFFFSHALTHGWRRTVPVAFAPLLSDIPIIVLVLFVLNQMPPMVLHILQCAGGFLLLYLAFRAFQDWLHFTEQAGPPMSSGADSFFKGVLINILNPNPYIGWSLVMGPLLLKAWRESPANGVVLLVSFYGVMVICNIIMIYLFAAARSLGPRLSRTLIGLSTLALAAFGLYQLYQGALQLTA